MGNPEKSGKGGHDRRSPEERWRDDLLLRVREILAWYPSLTHASITTVDASGARVTAYARREGPGYVSSWLRRVDGLDPDESERCHLPASTRRPPWRI